MNSHALKNNGNINKVDQLNAKFWKEPFSSLKGRIAT